MSLSYSSSWSHVEMYEGKGENKKTSTLEYSMSGVRNTKKCNFGIQHVRVRNLTAISSPYVLMCNMRKLS